VVEQLSRDAGYEPIYAGELDNAGEQERLIGLVFAISQGGIGALRLPNGAAGPALGRHPALTIDS
jgi:predicted dinucleotide-binding enzyme